MRPVPRRDAPARSYDRLLLPLLLGILVVARAAIWIAGPGPQSAGDTNMYLSYFVSHDRFLFVDFTGGSWRPWVVTLPFALLWHPDRIVAYQQVVSLLAWGFLVTCVHLALRPRVERIVACTVVLLLALSPTVTGWNFVLMSEATALSALVMCAGACLLLASERDVVRIAVPVFCVAFVVLSMLRLPFLVLAPLFLVLLITRSRWVRQPEGDRRPWRMIGVVALVFTVLGSYVVVEQHRADYAWGRQFAGVSEMQGRTLQQIYVLNYFTPWGTRLVHEKSEEVQHQRRCIVDGYAAKQSWIDIAKQCPTGSRELAAGFERYLVLRLAGDPVLAAHALRVPVLDAFGVAPAGPTKVTVFPGWLGQLLFGFWTTLTLGLVALAGTLVVARRRAAARWWVLVVVAGLFVVGVAVLLILAAFSPFDIYRVAVTPVTLMRICDAIVLALLVGRVRAALQSRRGRVSAHASLTAPPERDRSNLQQASRTPGCCRSSRTIFPSTSLRT